MENSPDSKPTNENPESLENRMKFKESLKELKENLRKVMETQSSSKSNLKNSDEIEIKKKLMPLSEIFDTKYRSYIWNKTVDFIDADDNPFTKKALLKEIFMIDIKMFLDFCKINSFTVRDVQNEKSLRLIESFRKGPHFDELSHSEEFIENQDLNFKLIEVYERILNYFYAMEFYLVPKLRHKNKLPGKSVWSLNLVASRLAYKALGMLFQTVSTLIDAAFASPILTKHLMSLGLVAYLGIHASFTDFKIGGAKIAQFIPLALPLASKFLKWCGLFNYLSEMMTLRDTKLYINAINSSLSSTITDLEDFALILSEKLSDYLNANPSEEGDYQFFEEIQALTKKFSEGSASIEKLIENNQSLKLAMVEKEGGWIELESKIKSEINDLKSTYVIIDKSSLPKKDEPKK